ncbi:phosphoglucosamine mutase family protein [Striga hermonthica]|uniref:phosphoglucomutase (alpha-D-glucose-1,6-bisphosphate-dependent) n=1 Tax=Striga hermonthica TaxID=68872 RepID=A0A9N7MTQ5_STRHE|nr:phosphoglucosamine mutase family protein [Striga hermonthica]
MKEDVLQLAGPQFTHGHWFGGDARCVVEKAYRGLMNFQESQTWKLHHRFQQGYFDMGRRNAWMRVRVDMLLWEIIPYGPSRAHELPRPLAHFGTSFSSVFFVLLCRFSFIQLIPVPKMAAVSSKVVQHVLVAHCCQQDRQLSTQYQKDCCTPNRLNLFPHIRRKLAWTQISTMQLHTFSKFNRGIVYCNAAAYATVLQPVDRSAFLKLQNGSDIRGVAIDGVEGEPINLTEPVTEAIAAAFVEWLLNKKKPAASRQLKVSIGHDSRISAQKLQDAVSRGLAGAGVEVIQYGLASTPAMFNSTLTKSEEFLCPVDGSIMITASHLPYNRNGFKFFTDAGGLGKADIKDILERAADIYRNFTDESLKDSAKKAAKSVKRVDYMSVYTSDLVGAVRKAAGNKEKPLEGFHIVVDAGNGAGGFFAGKVLEPLGATTSGSQFLEPDGHFPNHIPNPEDKEAMTAITRAVLDNNADMGIIFDTDVDRSAAVDSTGRELNRNRLIALMSAIVLEEHPGTTIVTDSVTSDGLTIFIEKKLGGRHHRFKRGYKNVIDEAIRLNSVGEESYLAIETSGHGALKENHWLDDGAYLMVKLLNKLASAKASGVGQGSKVLTDMVDGLEEPGFAVELRLKIDQNHADLKGGYFRDYGEAVLQYLTNIVDSDPKLAKAPVNYEGVRVSGYGGWFLLRLSLHDPVLPLNIEAPSKEEAVKLGLVVLSAVREFHALDTSALDKFIS